MTHAQDALRPIERYALLDDAWAFVLADRMTAPAWLDLTEGFADERDLTVWERLLSGLRALDRLVDGDGPPGPVDAGSSALTAAVRRRARPRPGPRR